MICDHAEDNEWSFLDITVTAPSLHPELAIYLKVRYFRKVNSAYESDIETSPSRVLGSAAAG